MGKKKIRNKKSRNRKLDCQMCENLEKYKILYQAYADEIRNLWQRSVFLGAFMTLAWGGYGALQLKFIDKILDKSFGLGAYHYYSILLCFVIIILSLLWIAMAKGSKFVQEAHEEHIENLGFDKIQNNERLFCDLNIYEPKLKKENKLSKELFLSGVLKAYRYSPSRINIVLGWFSVLMAIALGIVHMIVWAITLDIAYMIVALGCLVIVSVLIVVLICCITKSLKHYLKGGEQNKNDEHICKIILIIQKNQLLQSIFTWCQEKSKKLADCLCK